MILRRVVTLLKQQHWTGVFIELVIVVLGVFMGLQVQEWAGARAQAEQQRRFHERLVADFESIKRRIEEHYVTFNHVIDGADYVLGVVRAKDGENAGAAFDPARFKAALSILTDNRIPPGRSATYVEMLSASQLSALRSSELRNKLAEYDRACDIHLEVFRSSVASNAPEVPILFRHFRIATTYDESALSRIRSIVLDYDLDGMRKDPEFETAVIIIEMNARNNLGVRRVEGRLVDEILGLLREKPPQ